MRIGQYPVRLQLCFMKRTRHSKNISFTGLFLLTVFVHLYLVQLACNLPHLVQRLQPVASTAHHHSTGHGEHSHSPGHGTPTSAHHGDRSAHQSGEHPASSTEDTGCCVEQEYAPFLKSSPSVELSQLVKAPIAFMDTFYQAVLGFLYKSHITDVTYTPPDAPVPKIPDIRVFLHSLII